ncbi:recombinase family protein [Lactiplantibacillus plantarum]|uniref:recombinase family protein n=1 Tax=Lactiplantibacillus plantarum TaxID=1590 RepID=UPI001BA4D764|nr:recombinase family protein [Lactiplantibacillus plantarum]MBS0956823.1 recombinase family protein [Lactiplantibacillus plantarum]
MKTIKIGYARVSTGENRQELGMEVQLGALKKQHCNYVFSEKLSGGDDDRPEFGKALALAEELSGQYKVKFIVYKLDRLARHSSKSIMVIEQLTREKIQVQSLQEALDMSTPAGILQYQILANFSEFELNTIRQRTRDALAQLKKNGKTLGRPRINSKVENEVCRLYQMKEYPIDKIMEKTGVGRSSIFRIAKRNNLRRRLRSLVKSDI